MKEYEVTITETLQKTVTVQAESQNDARDMVSKAWNNGEIELDYDDFVDVEYETDEGTRIPEPYEVLVVEPGKHPHVETIEPGLDALQEKVGGYVESMYCFDDPVAVICNEEGKINGLELNRAIRNSDGEMIDIVAGTFLIAGLGEDDFASLSTELQEKYSDMFHKPEVFMRLGNSIMAFQVEEKEISVPKDKPSKGMER